MDENLIKVREDLERSGELIQAIKTLVRYGHGDAVEVKDANWEGDVSNDCTTFSVLSSDGEVLWLLLSFLDSEDEFVRTRLETAESRQA